MLDGLSADVCPLMDPEAVTVRTDTEKKERKIFFDDLRVEGIRTGDGEEEGESRKLRNHRR